MKINNKKAVSLMISYVLLVTIAIIMSIIVFTYLKTIANVEPVIDCKEGTSIVVEDYSCDAGSFDVINLSQILEHAFDINLWASKAHHCLRKGGVLAIALPNFNSFFSFTIIKRKRCIFSVSVRNKVFNRIK